MVLLDGLGDQGQPVLDGHTPLEAAHTPHLDLLAGMGMNGLLHPQLQGMAMPSELAHFLILGYERADFPGRGYLEALGLDIPVKEGEVALLARLLSVIPRGDHIILEEENPPVDPQTCRVLQNEIQRYSRLGVEIEFRPTGGVQGILLLKGEVSSGVTDSNPLYPGRPLLQVLPLEGHQEDPRAVKTARVLNDYLVWCHRKLDTHPLNQERRKGGLPPINALGTQRAGEKRELTPFREKWGLRGMSLASSPIYWGLARALGMEAVPVEDSGDPEKDLKDRLILAYGARDFDFIHVHTKAPDEAAHTKDPWHKKEVIQALDRAMGVTLETMVGDPDVLLVVTSDHSTPSSGAMIHSGETVPLTMVGERVRRDRVERFNEVDCSQGALGLVRGRELMYLILSFMDRAQLQGLMDSPSPRAYTLGLSRPLTVKGSREGNHGS